MRWSQYHSASIKHFEAAVDELSACYAAIRGMDRIWPLYRGLDEARRRVDDLRKRNDALVSSIIWC